MATNPQLHQIDLRSDTVTRPTPEMYEAMQSAPVGDDVLGDDPTVAELERLAAEMVGKEAAVFVPSGTMSNQIALACHCQRGDAILLEEEAHILYYEVGGPAVIAGVVSWTLPSHRGAMDPAAVDKRILKANIHTPGTALVCIENTHNRAGGAVIPMDALREYRKVVDRHGVKLHLDGARVFNAAAALEVDVQEITGLTDTVSICLSKGLGSPVGSLLCGPSGFIEAARIWRKRLGGGMRQAGILAACGLISLRKMSKRLHEDHDNAKHFATSLQDIPGLSVDLSLVETNMVLADTIAPASEVMDKLKEAHVLCLPTGANRLRFVFHVDVSREKTDCAIEKIRACLS